MKGKYFILASLILVILTIGAVCASDDVSDEVAAEDAVEEQVAVADDSVIEAADEDDEILGSNEYSNSDFRVDYNTQIYIRNSSEDLNVITFTFWDITSSWNNYSYTFKVNGTNTSFYKTVTYDDSRTTLHVTARDLGITDSGDYVIEMWEKTRDSDQYRYKLNRTVHVFTLKVNGPSVVYYGNDMFAYVELPSDATGPVTVTFNGKTYNVSYTDGWGRATAKTDGLGIGSYTALVEFGGDALYRPVSSEFTFRIIPKFSIPGSVDFMGDTLIFVGESRLYTVSASSTSVGYVNLTLSYSNGTVIDMKNLTLSNGYAFYSLEGLSEGGYLIYSNFMIDNYSYYDYMYFEVVQNYAGFTASATSQITEGGYVNVIIDVSPATAVFLSIDGIETKFYAYTSHIDDLISGLSVGTHNITVLAWDDAYAAVFSKTFTVTVKAKPAADVIKMTLNKVKVKKSAKKIVLQSTIKVNGKAKKGLVVKFKFNKKTYSAKTDAKGIAKVTIKNSVLKKLKAGKKLTYQATYGKTVKKITVKVLK